MYLALPQPQNINKGALLGWVSNVAPVYVGIHLYFEVERNTGGQWYEVDPYGGSGEAILWE